jgi:hypothetical protein
MAWRRRSCAERWRERHAGSSDGVRGAQRRRRREWHVGGACRSRAPGEVAVQGNDVQSDDVQGGGAQRMVVFPLGELRPRPSWCAARSRAVREELQCGGCGRIRTGAAGSRVMDVGGCRGEGSGRHGPNTGRPRSSRRRRCEYCVANRKGRLRSEGGIRGRSNATRVRRAAQDRRWW